MFAEAVAFWSVAWLAEASVEVLAEADWSCVLTSADLFSVLTAAEAWGSLEVVVLAEALAEGSVVLAEALAAGSVVLLVEALAAGSVVVLVDALLLVEAAEVLFVSVAGASVVTASLFAGAVAEAC